MKRTLILLVMAAMILSLAVGASAYRVKLATDTSATGQIANDAASATPLNPVAGAEARYGLYTGNVVTPLLDPTLMSLKITGGAPIWYGKVWNVGGRTAPTMDLAVFSLTTATTYWPTGTWYLYEGIGDLSGDGLVARSGFTLSQLDSGVFNATTLAWGSASLKATLTAGSYFTISSYDLKSVVIVPEPGSIIAVLTGLVGLVGLRRRK